MLHACCVLMDGCSHGHRWHGLVAFLGHASLRTLFKIPPSRPSFPLYLACTVNYPASAVRAHVSRRVLRMLHVTLDLYGCNPDRLADEAFLRGLLEEYPTRINMI